jgi:DNA-directed RNA polymerase sigma subunit (sigma70/sigma32)
VQRAEELDRPVKDKEGATVGELMEDANLAPDQMADVKDRERALGSLVRSVRLSEQEKAIMEWVVEAEGEILFSSVIAERLGVTSKKARRLRINAVERLRYTVGKNGELLEE